MVEVVFKKEAKELYYNGVKLTDDNRLDRVVFRTREIAEKEIKEILKKHGNAEEITCEIIKCI